MWFLSKGNCTVMRMSRRGGHHKCWRKEAEDETHAETFADKTDLEDPTSLKDQVFLRCRNRKAKVYEQAVPSKTKTGRTDERSGERTRSGEKIIALEV